LSRAWSQSRAPWEPTPVRSAGPVSTDLILEMTNHNTGTRRTNESGLPTGAAGPNAHGTRRTNESGLPTGAAGPSATGTRRTQRERAPNPGASTECPRDPPDERERAAHRSGWTDHQTEPAGRTRAGSQPRRLFELLGDKTHLAA
jgi:hypothetical protein